MNAKRKQGPYNDSGEAYEDQQEIINDLVAALELIAEKDTVYPPNYETFSDSEKIAYPPLVGKLGAIARAALARAKGEA